MTIIVYDGDTIVVDRAGSDGTRKWEQVKIWPHTNGELLTGTGPAATIMLMRDWYVTGADPSKFPHEQRGVHWCEFIVVSPHRLVRYEQSHIPIDHGKFKCAFGNGRDFAYGAMAAGADAIEAAEIACQFSTTCGCDLDVYSWEELNVKRTKRQLN
jgi:hypothetical protein